MAMLLLPLVAHADAGAAAQRTTTVESTTAEEGAGTGGYSVKQRIIKWMLNDEKFVEKAAEGSLAEVEFSKLALQKSQTQQVMNFAQKMVEDHTAASMELKGIAQSEKLPVPTTMNSEHQAEFTRLNQLTGAEFDKAYIDAMHADHDKDVALFAAAAASEKIDPKLQGFAQRTLPVLRSHLRHVESLIAANASAAR